MIYTCPKCGKKMDLSVEVLINSDYKVVCPQCLCRLHIVGDYAYIPNETLELDTTVERSHTINCPKCGHEASSGVHFCPNCGTSFDTPEPTPVTTGSDAVTGGVQPPPIPPVPPVQGADPLYNEAVRFIQECVSITPMMLRDRFHITDERAAELIRQLEAGGVIGPYNNGGPRQILIPHQSMMQRNPRTFNPQTGTPLEQGTPQQGMPRRGGMSCFTWFIIIAFLIMMMRACGG